MLSARAEVRVEGRPALQFGLGPAGLNSLAHAVADLRDVLLQPVQAVREFADDAFDLARLDRVVLPAESRGARLVAHLARAVHDGQLRAAGGAQGRRAEMHAKQETAAAAADPLPGWRPHRLDTGDWGSLYVGDTSGLPAELVGARITVQPKQGPSCTGNSRADVF